MTEKLARMVRRHWLLVLFLVAGLILRVITQLAYQPALLYIDSFRYLNDLGVFFPGGINPIGYELVLLGPVLLVGNLTAVAVVQHLLGLALGVAIYALLRRFEVRRWLSALAAAPVLLDAYQLQIEQMVMSDPLFQVLLIAVVSLLTWWRVPGPKIALLAGALLGFSVLVRTVGLTLIVPAAVFVLLAAGFRPKDGWKRRLVSTAALSGAFVGVLFVYAMYHMMWTGFPALSGASGSVVFGRTAVVAKCEELDLTPTEELVCPDEPVSERKKTGIDHYIHHYNVEENVDRVFPEGVDHNAVQSSFAKKVLFNQPLDVIGGVLHDFFKGFAPTRTQSVGDVPLDRWQFQTSYPMYAASWYVEEWAELYDDGEISVNKDLASFLRGYQLHGGYTPGIVLGGALLISVGAILGVGRARRSGLQMVCLLPAGMATTVLLTAAAMEFSWRYQLPGLVLLPVAGALGITALTRRQPPREWDHPAVHAQAGLTTKKENAMPTTYPDQVDRSALHDYQERYGDRRFAPVVVLIAAYNEEDALGGVLDGMPTESCGLPVDTLVVVDGSTDSTADVALRHGAQACIAPVNRGQGAALRLGYKLAAERGASYIVTTDADGQYDIMELPKLLQPLIDDEADFVTGSRRLGRSETTDQLRRAGTYVFAWLVSALTAQQITDTTFGFRGMKAEVPNSVTLEQPQYQSSELLIGTLARGYRVKEQPMTMLARTAGQSKKGNNILYGYRYAKVVLGTWMRERQDRANPKRNEFDEAVNEPAPAVGER